MASWTNSDGLKIYFGQEEGAVGIGGEYRTHGLFREEEIVLNLVGLTQTETVISDILIPKNAYIGRVDVICDTAAATGTAIDVGLVRATGDNEIDYNGILAAFPTGSMDAEGETTTLTDAVTYAGVLVGAITSATYVGHLSASITDATAFTAGRIRIKIYLYYKSATT